MDVLIGNHFDPFLLLVALCKRAKSSLKLPLCYEHVRERFVHNALIFTFTRIGLFVVFSFFFEECLATGVEENCFTRKICDFG